MSQSDIPNPELSLEEAEDLLDGHKFPNGMDFGILAHKTPFGLAYGESPTLRQFLAWELRKNSDAVTARDCLDWWVRLEEKLAVESERIKNLPPEDDSEEIAAFVAVLEEFVKAELD